MTNEQITHLRKLLADASPGPWAVEIDDEDEDVQVVTLDCSFIADRWNEDDARLFVALRNNATAMLDEIEAARQFFSRGRIIYMNQSQNEALAARPRAALGDE